MINQPDPPWGEDLIGDIQCHFPFPCTAGKVELGLKETFDLRRRQYHSTPIILKLIDYLPNPEDKILGIIGHDIFVPVLTFLFGEAQLNGSGAIVSTYRLHNSFYGLEENEQLFYDRVLKSCLHELGHTFGRVHCDDYRCVMYASSYVEESDLKAASFCERCRFGRPDGSTG